MKLPLCIELFAGAMTWSAGWLALGGRAIGFDIEHCPHHGPVPEGADLVMQNVLTLDGRQFKDASLILASPPCTEYSFMAMPWKRAKQIGRALRGQDEFPQGYTGSRTVKKLTSLFDACFRIQREASEAAGRHIPMVVENVKGAQPWVGRAKGNFGSYFLWGDVASVGGRLCAPRAVFGQTVRPLRAHKSNPDGTNHGQGSWFAIANSKDRGSRAAKVPRLDWSGSDKPGYKAEAFNTTAEKRMRESTKNAGGSWSAVAHNTESGCGQNPDGRAIKQVGSGAAWFDKALDERRRNATKCGGAWFGSGNDMSMMRQHNSKSNARKAASAQIARIPFALSQWVAEVYWPLR